METKGKTALVAGMARSGIACARLLLEEGARVILSDSKRLDELSPEVAELLRTQKAVNGLGADPMTLLDGVDMVVLSPAISREKPFVLEAKRRGAEILGEIELGYRYAKGEITAITGTNGKTTTTALTGEMFKAAGRNTFVLGNIGIPIVSLAKKTEPGDVIVAEVAGFQLETTSRFRARSCALLNITEDHLDRFGTMENYAAAKAMVFHNQRPEDFAAINLDDPLAAKQKSKVKGRLLWFSRLQEVENGAFLRGGNLIFRLGGVEEIVCHKDDVLIPGEHNLENALAALCAAMPLGVSAKAAATALTTFTGVEHRIELVDEKAGVRYINDSKGTNPDSTVKAVRAAKRPTVLMLGGSNKNSDYIPVFGAFEGRITAVVALGETRFQIQRDAEKVGFHNLYVCDGPFEEAFRLAVSLAQPGYDVLLSPACASYDMFDNFEKRGSVFKELVKKLN